MSTPTFQLSYSSWKTLTTCQQKYWLAKVAKVEKDSDYEESDALGLGKAFHWVLEQTLHESYNEKLILAAMAEFNVDASEKMLLTAMLDNYIKVHRLSGLKVVKCEMALSTPIFIGYIDFLAQGENGWWIGDLKTASKHDPSMLSRLPLDRQVNLYSFFAPLIAEHLGMKGEYLGFRYRQAIKTKNTTLAGIQKATPTYDIEIPASALDIQATWDDFLEGYEVAREVQNGAAPKKNLNACMEYFRACEYYSRCHGCLHSSGNPAVKVHTRESYESADLLG